MNDWVDLIQGIGILVNSISIILLARLLGRRR